MITYCADDLGESSGSVSQGFRISSHPPANELSVYHAEYWHGGITK